MVKIIADTTSCISLAEAQELGIGYIPQIIVFGEETYRDDTEMDAVTFMKRLRTSTVLPKTAAPPPALYTPIYKEIAERGDSAVVIAPSASLSGTYRSASVAAQDFPGIDIHVVDTRIIGGGLGAVVLEAVQAAKAGKTAKEIVKLVEEMSNRHRVYFMVDTLEYLYKGGRIGAAKALFGSLLQVKPILTIRNGTTEAYESQRTHKRAMARMREIILNDCPRDPSSHLCIMHGDVEAEAKQLAAELGSQLGIPVDGIRIYDMTPAILVHAGPGVIGVSYFVQPGQP
ncbi:MAG: DegV family protein [Chloroflexi bacterium]|nr:DegV family protein [Chloroflexota bacterium]